MQLSTFVLLAITGAASAQKFIHPSVDFTKCLTAFNNTGLVAIEPCTGDAAQLWTANGNTLTVFGGTTCLDNTNGNLANGNKVQIFQCFSGNTNQQWTISGAASASTITLGTTGKCLDNTDGVNTNGNPTQIFDCTGGRNQKWNITDPVVSFGNTISPGKSASVCLNAASNSDNAAVTIQTCSRTANQAWSVDSGNIRIFGNKCLDVPNGSTANGTKLQIFTCVEGNTNQLFTVTGDKRIAWTNKGECMDLTDGITTPGNPIQMFKCTDNNSNQVWNIL